LHLLTEREAASVLAVSQRTLQKWRLTGDGPPYAKVGRLVRYSTADLDAYVAQGRRRSTSDTPGEAA
jgi:excisionase family DNA binding protein